MKDLIISSFYVIGTINCIRMLRGGGRRTHGKMINAYRILFGKNEEKIPLGRCKWDNNIKMDHK
jgi:hypothetical protein